MSLLFLNSTLDGFQALDGAGNVIPLAKLTFWRSGTTTPEPIYSDQALTVEHPNPLTADAQGRFPIIYLSDIEYRVVLRTSKGVLRWDVDPYICDCTGSFES